MLTCPRCRSEEPEGSSFCGECGAPLAPVDQEPEPDHAAAAETPPILVCPACGSEEPDGSRFCGSCGASFEPEENVTAAAPPAPGGGRRGLVAAIAAIVLLLGAAAAAAVLIGRGGGSSTTTRSATVREVSERALDAPRTTAAQRRATPLEPTTTATTTAAPTTTESDAALAYVQQVDGLLRESHAVLLGLRSFVPRATSGAVSRGAAVATARSYLDQRRRELAQAQAVTAPPAFAAAHGLLIRSLQVSVADDEALVAWTIARRDGTASARAALDEVNRLGIQATAVKRQFVRVYGRTRRAATGRPAVSLPDGF